MKGPTFLGLGAQKAGSTWLYRALELHPDLWLPPVKELHFFDEKIRFERNWFETLRSDDGSARRWRRQIRTERRRRTRHRELDEEERSRRAWTSRYFFERPDFDWYESLFPADVPVRGEITPEYATVDEETIGRAVERFPDLRAVYLIRNPIEREWSAALMAIRGGNRRPEDVLRQPRRHVRYLDNIDRWTAALKPGHLYLGFTDDLTSCPLALLRDVVDFLGADPEASRLPTGRPNSSGVESIPAHFASALASELQDEIDGLAARYGGPPRLWAAGARDLTDSPVAGDIGYPLLVPPERSSPTSVVI